MVDVGWSVFVVTKHNVNAIRRYYLSVWTPSSLALLPAFITAITEVTVARLAILSAGREPELSICRYANEHMLAAFFWLFKALRGFGRLSHRISKRLFQTLRDQRPVACLPAYLSATVPAFPHLFITHLSSRCPQNFSLFINHLVLLLPAHLSLISSSIYECLYTEHGPLIYWMVSLL